MADIENQLDSSFPVKRKPDLCCQEQDNVANKAQKLNPSSSAADSVCRDGEVSVSGVENLKSSTIGTEASVSLEKAACSVSEKEDGDFAVEEKQESGVGEEEEEEEEEEDDSIEVEIDRKGKGISREDKGKGKLIEFDDSDDDDEDGDVYYESDLSEDPLAEVDLDNILPSRTRRRSVQPGVYMSNDRGGGNNEDDDDDDSSDDSEA